MVNMNGIGTSNIFQAYGKMQDYSKKQPKAEKNDETVDATKEVNSKVELSDKAQQLLDKIKEKYGDMDVFVADFADNDEAQSIMSRGTKDYSLLISPDELEKMAEDEDYANKQFASIDQSKEMCKEINDKYGVEAALKEDGDSTVVKSFGISIGSDGTTTLFANLEQMSAKQKERIRAAREAKAEEAKEAKEEQQEKIREHRKADALKIPEARKQTTVKANSLEDLMKQISEVDWSNIAANEPQSKFDFRG